MWSISIRGFLFLWFESVKPRCAGAGLHTEPIKYLATISTYILLHKENPFNVYILYLDNMRLIVNNFIIVNMFTR